MIELLERLRDRLDAEWNDMVFYGPPRSSKRDLRRQLVAFLRQHPEYRGEVKSEQFDTFTEQGHGKFHRDVARYRVTIARAPQRKVSA
jgi:hypothetical protein